MPRSRVLSVFAACAVALLFFSTAHRAHGQAAPGGPALAKIGVVNFQKAIQDTAELKKAQAELAAKFKPRTDEYEKANRDLNDLQIQLQNSQGKGLSQAAEVELNAKAQRKQREVERMKEDLEMDMQGEQEGTVQRLGSRMVEVVKKLMDDKGLDAIFDTTAAVAYKDTINLTGDATAAYDKAYPVPAK
jgi:outer membrane protein